MDKSKIHMVAFLLVIVGGLNWGLVGIAGFNLVEWLSYDLLGMMVLAKIIYILVGAAAVYELVSHKANCHSCGASAAPAPVSDDAGM